MHTRFTPQKLIHTSKDRIWPLILRKVSAKVLQGIEEIQILHLTFFSFNFLRYSIGENVQYLEKGPTEERNGPKLELNVGICACR